MKKINKTFPIEIHVSECRAREGQEVVNSMICNYEAWQKGKEELRWKLGEHISNNLKLVVDRSMLDD